VDPVKRNHAVAVALALAAVLLAVVVVRARRPKGPATAPVSKVVKIEVAESPPEPSVWVDVHAPAKAWGALRKNGWVQRALAEPLGQGFAAGWTAFLSTSGKDLGGAFEGQVLDLVVGRLLADPFRVVTYAGADATGTPALVVANPTAEAKAAFDLMESVARSGTFEAVRCPGPKPAENAPAPAPISVSRWLVAEHALYGARVADRLVLARHPMAVVQALCALPPDVPRAEGIDVSISFARTGLGREAQLFAALLGVGPTPRLAFGIEGEGLVPRGILGALDAPGRLDGVAPSDTLLKLVPADTGVLLLASLRLPAPLDRKALAKHLDGKWTGATEPRTLAVLWNPGGERDRVPEVAVLWPERDRRFLDDAFSGPNELLRRRACGHEVLASTAALADAAERSCRGRQPSLLDAAPPVVAGVRAPVSVGLGFNVGGLLSRLVADAWRAERGEKGALAPEVEAARRLLEELPYLGLRGVAKGDALVPGGFKS
jgi:hypothetical protein